MKDLFLLVFGIYLAVNAFYTLIRAGTGHRETIGPGHYAFATAMSGITGGFSLYLAVAG